MRAVFGIGNPGKRYRDTRHNAGFLLLDRLAEKLNLVFQPSKSDFYFANYSSKNTSFYLIKPTTFVNLSGIAAEDFLDEFQIDIQDFLVVVDDLNLELGTVRIRKSGGDGGHNGLNSIIYNLQDDQFPRLRFGIGSKFEKGDMKNYVLDKFDSETLASLKPNFDFATDIITEFLKNGFKGAQDYYSKNASNIASILNNTKNEGN